MFLNYLNPMLRVQIHTEFSDFWDFTNMKPPTGIRHFDFRTELTIYFSRKEGIYFAYKQS